MVALSLLVALALGFLAVFWLSPLGAPALKRYGGGKPSPDLSFSYDPEQTYRLLDMYGPRGVAHWRRMLLLDMIFPGVYGTLLALLADQWAVWAEVSPVWRTAAVACPIVSAMADYVENILLLRIIAALPRRLPAVVNAACTFTRIKFAFFAATLLVPLAHWSAALAARLI